VGDEILPLNIKVDGVEKADQAAAQAAVFKKARVCIGCTNLLEVVVTIPPQTVKNRPVNPECCKVRAKCSICNDFVKPPTIEDSAEKCPHRLRQQKKSHQKLSDAA